MSHLRIRIATIVAILALTGIAPGIGRAAGVPGTSEKEALAIVISKWNAGCSGSNVSTLDNNVDAWYDNMTSYSKHGSKEWTRDGFYKNGDIADSWFTDTTVVSFGRDYENDHVDADDAVMVGLHGNHNGSGGPWYGLVRVNESGGGDCYTLQSSMLFGDKDLEFLHLASCHSMCEPAEGYRNWKTAFDRLHQVSGYYGIAYSSSSLNSDYKWFADDGFDIGIAESWCDNLWHSASYTGVQDMCPAVMVQGTSSSNASTRISYEEYDYVYSDTSAGHYVYLHYPTCDPKDHNP
jgi:hypothetical protein